MFSEFLEISCYAIKTLNYKKKRNSTEDVSYCVTFSNDKLIGPLFLKLT